MEPLINLLTSSQIVTVSYAASKCIADVLDFDVFAVALERIMLVRVEGQYVSLLGCSN